MGVKIEKHRTSAANGWKFPLLCGCRDALSKRYGPTKWDTNIRDWGDEEVEEQPKAEPKPNVADAPSNVAPIKPAAKPSATSPPSPPASVAYRRF
jgi:hypothetical protein